MSKVEIKEPEYHLFPYVEKTALVVAITVCALSAIASVIGYSNNSPWYLYTMFAIVSVGVAYIAKNCLANRCKKCHFRSL